MKISERAKIFGAFSPLKGFYEEILKKEKVIVPKSELLDDRIDEIELALKNIEAGTMVTVTFYNDGEYQKLTGCVSGFFPEQKYLTVIKTKIMFEDIYDLVIDK